MPAKKMSSTAKDQNRSAAAPADAKDPAAARLSDLAAAEEKIRSASAAAAAAAHACGASAAPTPGASIATHAGTSNASGASPGGVASAASTAPLSGAVHEEAAPLHEEKKAASAAPRSAAAAAAAAADEDKRRAGAAAAPGPPTPIVMSRLRWLGHGDASSAGGRVVIPFWTTPSQAAMWMSKEIHRSPTTFETRGQFAAHMRSIHGRWSEFYQLMSALFALTKDVYSLPSSLNVAWDVSGLFKNRWFALSVMIYQEQVDLGFELPDTAGGGDHNLRQWLEDLKVHLVQKLAAVRATKCLPLPPAFLERHGACKQSDKDSDEEPLSGDP